MYYRYSGYTEECWPLVWFGIYLPSVYFCSFNWLQLIYLHGEWVGYKNQSQWVTRSYTTNDKYLNATYVQSWISGVLHNSIMQVLLIACVFLIHEYENIYNYSTTCCSYFPIIIIMAEPPALIGMSLEVPSPLQPLLWSRPLIAPIIVLTTVHTTVSIAMTCQSLSNEYRFCFPFFSNSFVTLCDKCIIIIKSLIFLTFLW